ncbi:HAD family hydrolase [Micromonospora sp. DT233]|uniref:HAD family hydrolase n=1 Tax=Micromonospora sp. DT233 TaxID=3393432 RepID=UPI003CFA3885
MMLKMPQPVIFDLFHTLIHGADEERDRVVGEMAVIVGVAPAELVAAYHASWRERLIRWDVEETIRILAGRLGGTPTNEEVTKAGEQRRALACRVLDRVSTGTLDVLDALRGDGHPLALISNATSDTAELWPQSRLARRFDVAIFSCEVGLAKPDPAIYHLAAERLGVEPAECVFVGDGADGELAGAAAVGMTVFRTTEHNDTDPGWVGPAFATLGDLPAILREPRPTRLTQRRTMACSRPSAGPIQRIPSPPW